MTTTSLFKAGWMWPTMTETDANFNGEPVISLQDACFWFWRVKTWRCVLDIAGEVEADTFSYSNTVAMSDWCFSDLITTLVGGHQTMMYDEEIGTDVFLDMDIILMPNGASRISDSEGPGIWVPEISISIDVSEIEALNDVEIGGGANPDKATTGNVTFTGFDAVQNMNRSLVVPVRFPVKSDPDNPYGFSSFDVQFEATSYWSHNGTYDTATGALL